MTKFRHQAYPTQPERPPQRKLLTVGDSDEFDFGRLHAEIGVARVLIIHGTFMGDDPFGIGDVLKTLAESVPFLSSQLQGIADAAVSNCRALMTSLTSDVGNYVPEFCDKFQQLVGTDPVVELLHPTWSGQNHHWARADLAVRLLAWLLNQPVMGNERFLLWGHSHAGNGFALLSNLLANDRESVEAFFEAAGYPQEDHWLHAHRELTKSSSPHPLSERTLFAAFGTPVRYGWDVRGMRSLVHILHDRTDKDAVSSKDALSSGSELLQPGSVDEIDLAEDDLFRAGGESSPQTRPLFPPHLLSEILTARYGDWVQAFAIAGTDTTPMTSGEVIRALHELLETSSLARPADNFSSPIDALRLVPGGRMRDLCRRWKTGTRCHETGLNQLVDYVASGKRKLGVPLERTVMGHGVATTLTWLPAHLRLVIESFSALENER